jgi:hypothetical protein
MERYRGGQWTQVASLSEPRWQHSTAVLLETGKVLIGGSESHTVSDYEVYVPWYIACGAPRPVIQTVHGVNVTTPGYTAPTVTANQGFYVTCTVPTGAAVSKVVLTRAGSMTHGLDTDQRYVAMEMLPPVEGGPPGVLTVVAPKRPGFTSSPSEVAAPPGYYMLWVVTSTGIPSVAAWIRLQ